MAWWIWMILGLALLSLEMFAIDAQFYLIFIGIGGLIVGMLELIGVGLPPWAQWVLFAVLSLLAMFTMRKHVYQKLRGQAVGLKREGSGDRIEIGEPLSPGESCRAEYRGSLWTAINVGREQIPAGSTAVIDAIEGLNLKVRLRK